METSRKWVMIGLQVAILLVCLCGLVILLEMRTNTTENPGKEYKLGAVTKEYLVFPHQKDFKSKTPLKLRIPEVRLDSKPPRPNLIEFAPFGFCGDTPQRGGNDNSD